VAIRQSDVISHYEMCQAERRNLQQGMNFRPGGRRSVILMSLRKGAPYADRLEDDGRVLIYEGHDEPRSADAADPKAVDQPEYTAHGRLNQNGQFARAAGFTATKATIPSWSTSTRRSSRTSGRSTASSGWWTRGKNKRASAKCSS
jgi:hypothetical protein